MLSAKAGSAADAAKRANGSAKEAGRQAASLLWYTTLLAKSVNPRLIDDKRFIEIMNEHPHPRASAEIWFEPNDDEARIFAVQISDLLGSKGMKWEITRQEELPLEHIGELKKWNQRTVLEKLRVEASTGLAVGANKISPEDVIYGKTLWGALNKAIELSSGGSNISGVGGHWETGFPTLPDKYFIVVVGHHRINVPLFTPSPAGSAEVGVLCPPQRLDIGPP